MKETEIFQALNAERRPEEPDADTDISYLSIKTHHGEAEVNVFLKNGGSYKVSARVPGDPDADPLDEQTRKNVACVALALEDFFKRKQKWKS